MDRESIIKDQEASGQSIVEYCAKRGIRPNNFYNWRNQVKAGGQKFARVESGGNVSLELEGGVKLRVAIEDLKAVLAALR